MKTVKKTAGWMKRHRRLSLILLYVAVILVPGVVLGVLAMRALDREEAYVEKTLKNTLLTEVTHTVDSIQAELVNAQESLRSSLAFPASPAKPYQKPPLKADANPLIDTVFVLSPDKEILWPNAEAELEEHEKQFLYWNAPLMTDRVKVPVVKNIVMEYKDEIINNPPATTDAAGKPELRLADAVNADQKREDRFRGAEAQTAADNADKERRESAPAPKGMLNDKDDAGYLSFSEAPADTEKSSPLAAVPTVPQEDGRSVNRSAAPLSKQKASLEAEKKTREAKNIFQQNKPIQEKIYKQAEEEGKEVLSRVTVVNTSSDESAGNERSLFILSAGTFSDIISSASEGFLPRFLGDQFSLLYWVKKDNRTVIGCVVNLDALSERVLKILPEDVTPARVLVVLDNQGKPLHAPEGLELDWHLPFVAREIHEALPRWEAAAYLADPSYIASKAEATTSVLWVITAFLLIAIAGGGIIIIKLLLSELALAQKKTNLVTNVSHELKTPLTSIRLFAEMLMENVAPSRAKRREYCALLLGETERLSRLINNVLDFSKLSQGSKRYDKKTLDLVELCREVEACESVRLEKSGLQLAFSSNAKKLPFFGCRESLTRVLINLISNAEKYAGSDAARTAGSDAARTAGQGTAVEADNGSPPPADRTRIDIDLTKTSSGIVLRVMDRGPGIPAWAAKKIFREFFRVDDSLTAKTAGSGLGLTITKMIVTDHGGEIVYEPRPGGGSIFRITFFKERQRL